MTSAARIIPFAALFACAHGAPAPEPVRAYAEVNGLHMYYEIILGDHDFFPVEVGQHIAQAIPGAQLMIVPGAGHGTFMQRPELMNLAVLQFLDSEPPAAPDH